VGLAGYSKKSLRIGDLSAGDWQKIYRPLPVERDMSSELAVPIIGAGGGLEGVLNIESPQPDAFSDEDRLLLEALAAQAVIAIQEIRLLDALQEIVQVLLTADYDELLRLIIARACDLINVSDGSIWLVAASDTLVLRQSTDTSRIGETLSLRNSFTGQAVRLRQPVTIDDARFEPKFMHPELAERRGWASAIVVPLLAAHDNANPVGSFALYSNDLRDFSDWDKKLLTCLANHAAVSIRDAEHLRLLKQAQERQATAETIAAVGDVAANLVHQLNNKFGAISVRVQGIEAKCADVLAANPYLSANLREIAGSTRQAMAVVRDSMAPLQPLHAQPVSVVACILRALERAALPDSITVKQVNLDNLPHVLAGDKQLEMVFFNLIDNAANAMAGAGKLELAGKRVDDFVTVSVADSGPGILPAQQATIFEFAAGADQSAGKGRLRFGLWWVKTFVERFGGRVELDSHPNLGARFTVWLPVEKGFVL
jgi:signal transduction histidine kinase